LAQRSKRRIFQLIKVKNMKKEIDAVVVFSGGLDSTTLLYRTWLKKRGEIIALTFDYGQRHKKEIEFAKYHTKRLKVKHIVVKLPLDFKSSALINKKKKIPEKHYTHKNQKITVVPNRNMILLSYAIGVAENLKCKEVYYGAHKNDYAIYPDCRPEFVKAIDKTSQLATYNSIRVIAPFVNLYKYQIVKIGVEIGVPYHLTWSCYKNGKSHCGKCATCQERIESFVKNHIKPIMP